MTIAANPHIHTRQDVEFYSSGVICRAWLTYPQTAQTQDVPLVIMAHGFGGTREMRLEQYAQRFNNLGMATLIFDYRNFGASDGLPRQCLIPQKEVEDWHAALAFARRLPNINRQKIALWGTSFAGGLVVTVAAQDGKVAATVSQCPMLDGLASALEIARYAGLNSLMKVSTHGVVDVALSVLGKTHYIPTVAKEGEIGAMTSHDAYDAYLRLATENTTLINKVTARTGLLVPLFRPIKDAKKVKCPALLQICETDTVAPVAAVEKAAKLMPKSEVVRYPVGHFDVYFGEDFERSVSDQAKFLQKHLC
ncbi:alpha/beta hydrolase [Agitococcus lubricus]|uniref:Fermentation-respiration switch protein FrsA (DUF1100 family) n=1 Tax=Agitococcus lubricus TaxID=1077255 RepID=A0A2T5IYR5_9GAMM|nr:alpha/beta hydrolase [Agitococcus lubricus]PTQ89150.1 fermentation-respiration switch protein FrsA (DUF1100 family) [Agitococcus lubricus]